MCELNSGKTISPEAKLVLLVARWLVNGQGIPEIKNLLSQGSLRWAYVNDLLTYHEIAPFAYSCFKDCFPFIPAAEIELYKKHQFFTLNHLVYLEQEFIKISGIFLINNIELLPIKGMAFLIDNMYADKSYLRPMVDMDILVKQQKLEQIEILLKGLGYEEKLDGAKKEYWRQKNYHLIFTKKDGKQFYRLEVHWLLDYPGNIPILPSLWSRTRKCKLENKEISLLSHEDTVFCLALHLRRFGRPIALKAACDFATVIHKYKELDWDYILKEAKRGRMRASLYFRLIQATLLFDVKAPDYVFKNLRIPRYKKHLIQHFIQHNTFLQHSSLDGNNSQRENRIYLKNHFLVYDDFLTPVKMILHIPQEQFARFYNLPIYSPSTSVLYKLRFFYIAYSCLILIVRAIAGKMAKLKKK